MSKFPRETSFCSIVSAGCSLTASWRKQAELAVCESSPKAMEWRSRTRNSAKLNCWARSVLLCAMENFCSREKLCLFLNVRWRLLCDALLLPRVLSPGYTECAAVRRSRFTLATIKHNTAGSADRMSQLGD